MKEGEPKLGIEKEEQPEKEKELTPEKIKDFQFYIDQVGHLIEVGEYDQAIDALSNKSKLETVGWKFEENSLGFTKNITKADVRQFCEYIGPRSWCDGLLKRIEVVRPYPVNKDIKIPQELKHEVSLLYIEEWLHVLQGLKGEPLTEMADKIAQKIAKKIAKKVAKEVQEDPKSKWTYSQAYSQQYSREYHGKKDEIDVTFYMYQLGIPLTDRFLDYYNRREALEILEKLEHEKHKKHKK